jgi:hypothetical protein
MRFGALSPLGVTAGCIQPRDWRAAGAPISGKPLSRLVLHSHATLRHSLTALEMLRISLSGPPNRHIQPERYVQWA